MRNDIMINAIELIHLAKAPQTELNDKTPPKRVRQSSGEFERWRYDVCAEIRKLIRKTYCVSNVKLELFNSERDNQKDMIYYRDEYICEMRGEIVCEPNCEVKKMLTQFCANESLQQIWFSLDISIFKSSVITAKHRIKYNSFQFGTMIELTHFVSHFHSDTYVGKSNDYFIKDWVMSQSEETDKIVDFEHDKKRINVYFRLKSGNGGRNSNTKSIRYKFVVKYSSLNSIVVKPYEKIVYENRNKIIKIRVVIYFQMKEPPLLYKVERDVNETNGPYLLEKGLHSDELEPSEYFIRENEIPGITSETIGKSNVFALEVPQIVNSDRVSDYKAQTHNPFDILVSIKRFAKIRVYFANIKENTAKNAEIFPKMIKNLPFAIHYAYRSVFSHTFQVSDELTINCDDQLNSFQKKIVKFASEDPRAVEAALFELSSAYDRGSIIRTLPAFESLYKSKRKISVIDLKKEFKAEIVDIRRCILTPSRLLFLPPQPTLKSRFIHNSNPDYAIRLSIREDNLNLLGLSIMGKSEKSKLEFLEKCIKNKLKDGFKIGDRTYEFLGSSTSQLRDNGMILYACDPQGRTAMSIREGMGDMTKIRKNVPKYVARLGLAFSQALTHIEMDDDTTYEVWEDIEGVVKPVVELPEVRNFQMKDQKNFNHFKRVPQKKDVPKDRYIFSDGIGMISKDLARVIYKQLPNECAHEPSAMQIRFRGCKGMLVVYADVYKREENRIVKEKWNGKGMIFRKSMEKYISSDNTLGILKFSAPRPVYLNRPLITILEALGVTKDVFHRMLMDNLRTLTNALICECAAFPLISNYSTLRLPYTKIQKSGIPILNEPFFREILDSLLKHSINELKSKARIKVPMNKGRTLFGVLDETATLEYGQIFVQITVINDGDKRLDEHKDFKHEQYQVLTGEVMVTKFPCMHPGDVRKFEAIDVPILRHIRDCIVFPAKGKRPHPDEMAGSDLDGDEYAIFWDCQLIFKRENHKAMDFPSVKAEELKSDAKVDDILDFYCRYMIGNNIGLIANSHLAFADRQKNGVNDDLCNRLAIKYAISLDFAKTGKVQKLEWYEMPFMYPDFMEKFEHKRTYLSNRVLGQLYRQCDRFEMGLHSNTEKSQLEISLQPNPTFNRTGWELYENDAISAFEEYKKKVSHLMDRFGIQSEAALLCGAYSKGSKYMTGRTETNDVHELLETLVNNTFKELKIIFDNQSKGETEDEIKLRACAWYMVTYKYNANEQRTFFGFPWTVTDYLCKVPEKENFNINEPHECVRHSAQIMNSYLIEKYIHQNPQIDPKDILSDDFDPIKIQSLRIEAALETAEIVLRAWLERQQNLFVKKKNCNGFVTSVPSQMMADMDKNLHRSFKKIREENLSKAEHTNLTIPTPGSIVMNFMKMLVNDWLSVDTIDKNNRITDTPLTKFGFAALKALDHFFRTRQISHIVDLNPKFEVSLPHMNIDQTFYIPLIKLKQKQREENDKQNVTAVSGGDSGDNGKSFAEVFIQNKDLIMDILKELSGVSEIVCEPYQRPTRDLQYYYLLTATGTDWELSILKNIIAHPLFINDIRQKTLKRRNLRTHDEREKLNIENAKMITQCHISRR